MRCAGRTDTGKVRTNNEDNFLIDCEAGIFIVADGLGGHNAGEVASELAIEHVYRELSANYEGASTLYEIAELLESSIESAHRALVCASSRNWALEGMGTTIVVACISHDAVVVGNVGDSRAYLIRGAK